MKLQTEISLTRAQNQIGYNAQILILGSCFANNIGGKLGYFKFQSLQNPFGVLFHPKAIENLISKSVNQETYFEKDVFFHNERWHCFDAHSDLSDASKENLIQSLNKGLTSTNKQIHESTHIIITLGTAWVYRNIESGNIVANCHKIQQSEFKKELLPIEEILDSLNKIQEKISSINKKAKLIFTISPVRHLKDGFIDNQRSKANLISSVQKIVNGGAASYFPSYEIMMDELRDYRFYESDMVHPNQIAIDYIWEKFKEVWISEKSFPVMEKVDEIQKGLQHRPFNPDSEQHKKFIKSLTDKIKYLQQDYPYMEFSN